MSLKARQNCRKKTKRQKDKTAGKREVDCIHSVLTRQKDSKKKSLIDNLNFNEKNSNLQAKVKTGILYRQRCF